MSALTDLQSILIRLVCSLHMCCGFFSGIFPSILFSASNLCDYVHSQYGLRFTLVPFMIFVHIMQPESPVFHLWQPHKRSHVNVYLFSTSKLACFVHPLWTINLKSLQCSFFPSCCEPLVTFQPLCCSSLLLYARVCVSAVPAVNPSASSVLSVIVGISSKQSFSIEEIAVLWSEWYGSWGWLSFHFTRPCLVHFAAYHDIYTAFITGVLDEPL